MDKYAQKDSVSLIMFNLGYLPECGITAFHKGKMLLTIEALEKGLNLLHEGEQGISPFIYSGGDSGFEEKNGKGLLVKALENCRMINILYLWEAFIIINLIICCRFIF